MRFVWFLAIIGLVFSGLMYCFCILTGENMFSKYKKGILSTIFSFAVLFFVLYLTFIFIGLLH